MEDVFTRGLSNMCETESLMTPYSTSGIKFIGLNVVGSSRVHIKSKERLNVESLEIDPTILKTKANLLNSA